MAERFPQDIVHKNGWTLSISLGECYHPPVEYRMKRFFREESWPLLLLLLLAGLVAHFLLSPGSVLADVPEVIIPLGISVTLLWYMYRVSRREYGENILERITRFGWIGMLGAVSMGTVWILFILSRESPIASLSDELMTGINIGTAVGILAGRYSLQTLGRNGSVEAFEPRREYVVAESTWTAQPHPNPILTEIVEQIADLEGVDPLAMTPISEYIDPDVFADLIERTDTQWQTVFRIENYEVRVSSHGTVTVYETDRSGDGAVEVSTSRDMR